MVRIVRAHRGKGCVHVGFVYESGASVPDDQRVTDEPFLSQLSDSQFRIVVGVVGALLVLLLVRLRFCYTPTVPKKPPKPREVATTAETNTALRASKTSSRVYLGHLETDAQRAGIAPPTLKEMSAAFKYRSARPNALLTPGGHDSIEVAGLRLELTARRKNGASIMVLAIENKDPKRYLAYRVHTRPTMRGSAIRAAGSLCARRQPALLEHNAMAVGPEQTVNRTECIYRRGMGLEIVEVETLEIPPLSYIYVSQLVPTSIGVEARETAKHALPRGAGHKFCSVIFSSSLQHEIDQKQITWRSLVDYFARHNCHIYRDFPEGYKAFTKDAERPLPVVP